MFHRKQNQGTEVPVVSGGTTNYSNQGGPGYGDQAGRDVNMKAAGAGYGYEQSGQPAYNNQSGQPGYNQSGGYVQQTPVSYGPDGRPIHMKKKSNNPANWCAAAFIACWACTWPCHGPCCCGL